MSVGKISVRYARALFLSARDQDRLDEVRTDMELFLATIRRNEDILKLLDSPIVDTSRKSEALTAIFKDHFSSLTLDFIKLVARNKREEFMPGMARHFIKLFKEEKGIQVARVISAVKMDSDAGEHIRELIRKAFKSEIELEQEVKKELIGGFVLRVENKQLDASVKGKLARIKKELQN
jgi:F-type H+-transporting ATPase subunit delta